MALGITVFRMIMMALCVCVCVCVCVIERDTEIRRNSKPSLANTRDVQVLDGRYIACLKFTISLHDRHGSAQAHTCARSKARDGPQSIQSQG